MNGIKEITTYKKNELGQTVKTVQKVKVSKKTVRVALSALRACCAFTEVPRYRCLQRRHGPGVPMFA